MTAQTVKIGRYRIPLDEFTRAVVRNTTNEILHFGIKDGENIEDLVFTLHVIKKDKDFTEFSRKGGRKNHADSGLRKGTNQSNNQDNIPSNH